MKANLFKYYPELNKLNSTELNYIPALIKNNERKINASDDVETTLITLLNKNKHTKQLTSEQRGELTFLWQSVDQTRNGYPKEGGSPSEKNSLRRNNSVQTLTTTLEGMVQQKISELEHPEESKNLKRKQKKQQPRKEVTTPATSSAEGTPPRTPTPDDISTSHDQDSPSQGRFLEEGTIVLGCLHQALTLDEVVTHKKPAVQGAAEVPSRPVHQAFSDLYTNAMKYDVGSMARKVEIKKFFQPLFGIDITPVQAQDKTQRLNTSGNQYLVPNIFNPAPEGFQKDRHSPFYKLFKSHLYDAMETAMQSTEHFEGFNALFLLILQERMGLTNVIPDPMKLDRFYTQVNVPADLEIPSPARAKKGSGVPIPTFPNKKVPTVLPTVVVSPPPPKQQPDPAPAPKLVAAPKQPDPAPKLVTAPKQPDPAPVPKLAAAPKQQPDPVPVPKVVAVPKQQPDPTPKQVVLAPPPAPQPKKAAPAPVAIPVKVTSEPAAAAPTRNLKVTLMNFEPLPPVSQAAAMKQVNQPKNAGFLSSLMTKQAHQQPSTSYLPSQSVYQTSAFQPQQGQSFPMPYPYQQPQQGQAYPMPYPYQQPQQQPVYQPQQGQAYPMPYPYQQPQQQPVYQPPQGLYSSQVAYPTQQNSYSQQYLQSQPNPQGFQRFQN